MSFRPNPVFRVLAALVLAISVTCAPDLAAQDDLDRPPILSGEGGVIPIRVIDGRMVVSCDISGVKLRVPINLWLDFDGSYGLQLHNRAAAPLPAETQGGKPSPLTLHFPDFELEIARRELGPEEEFEDFTKYHSKEIGEDALAGAIGAEVLKHFDVIFDLPRGQVSLLPPGGLASHQPDPSSGAVITPITLNNDLVWLPVNLDGPKGKLKRAMAIGSSRYDTVIERRLCNSLQRPAGNIGPLRCESIDFAPFVAFRPGETVQVHPDGVAGVMGVNLLENMRIHIDRQSLLVVMQGVGSPKFPEQDFAFFQAMITEDPQLVREWLETHGQTRLGREAAELLLTLFLDESAEEEELAAAIQWVNDTMPKDLRATRLFDLLEELVNEGEESLAIVAGQLGVKSARADRYPESNYKLHGRLGELLLPNDNREAWRHLLSAAFGLPEDGMINLNLGRCYEASGKKKRAFSRYVQALVKEESSELAMEALARLDAELPVEERMTIETIDRMISGRVRNYSAPTTFEVDPATRTNRTCLVEFFTNAYVGTEQRGGAIGGALGNQGLISHFADSECLFLSYHLPQPRLDPLVTPLASQMSQWLGIRGPFVQMVDGVASAPGAGKHRQAEGIYEAARDAVIGRLEMMTPFEIEADATLDGTKLSGQVSIGGPDGDPRNGRFVVQVVIAERGVVFHGSSGVVIHRMLARGLATEGSLHGVEYKPDARGKFRFEFERQLSELETENIAHYESLEAGQTGGRTRMGLRIEPTSVEVIVLVRDAGSGAVAQALRCDLQRKGAIEP